MHRGQENRARLVDEGRAEAGDHDPQSTAEIWTRVKRRLRAELGDDVYASWFARLEMDAIIDSGARLSVPTRFLKSWIEAHYADRVLAVLRSEAPSVVRTTITVRGTPVR
jgi:chromosomal replication initiator protein